MLKFVKIHISWMSYLIYLALGFMLETCPKFCLIQTPSLSVTLGQGQSLRFFVLHFYINVFKAMYLLNALIDLVDISADIRDWSKILFGASPSPLYDLQIKGSHLNSWIDLVDILSDVRYWFKVLFTASTLQWPWGMTSPQWPWDNGHWLGIFMLKILC